ncbi:MAG: glycine--tRNA ligase, partial [Planctomycetaceae bacterium]|jgi:glycyl-tRNA synthetase|nr:glycine--tRNA ligase [Planctomycetaceae bacterium]
MHPQVWKCSGHYDLFHDYMVDCRESKKRYRYDHVIGRWVSMPGRMSDTGKPWSRCWGTDAMLKQVNSSCSQRIFVTTMETENTQQYLEEAALKFFGIRKKNAEMLQWEGEIISIAKLATELVPPQHDGLKSVANFDNVLAPDAKHLGTLTEPREFNLMFKTTIGALGGEDDYSFLRPETAQGIFVNFKNVCDSTRVRVPFGIAQVGKSFRNEITPRNFTFRSREFEQMEIEFFCHPSQSPQWYQYWRDRRFAWYTEMGLAGERLRLREHDQDELSHYSCGTADIEYQFPFLPPGEYGELEGIAHRGDFDLRSHSEGKLVKDDNNLVVEKLENGQPKHRGSGKDLSYYDDLTKERYIPHVIEPSAGADRATLAFLCEAYQVDTAPDEKGQPQERVYLKFHPRLAPIKAAVFPLVKKDGMPEIATEIYGELKKSLSVFYDDKGAVGRRYRRQDEIGTPYCITVDGQTVQDGTVTIRDRDTLEQVRVKKDELVNELTQRLS